MDKNLNNLLRWGIENSSTSTADPSSQTDRDAQTSRIDPEVINALLGGPSDADLMKQAMAAIKSPEVDLENTLIAFDNFEQLIENLDNANNLTPLALWDPLVAELANADSELRAMAAWCIATAVQNNIKSQEALVKTGAIPTLAKMAIEDKTQQARKKAILALSSGVRNYQAAMDEALKGLPEGYNAAIDANDMGAVDGLIQRLRDESAKKGEEAGVSNGKH